MPKANSQKQGKKMAQIQGTTTLEGIPKGKKQVHHNDKTQKRDHQISATTGNSKKLYQLITNLTSQNKSNSLPSSTSDENLADEFATYFLEKICNIRKLFDGIPNYKPTPTNIPPLNKFSTLTESQLYKIIME